MVIMIVLVVILVAIMIVAIAVEIIVGSSLGVRFTRTGRRALPAAVIGAESRVVRQCHRTTL